MKMLRPGEEQPGSRIAPRTRPAVLPGLRVPKRPPHGAGAGAGAEHGALSAAAAAAASPGSAEQGEGKGLSSPSWLGGSGAGPGCRGPGVPPSPPRPRGSREHPSLPRERRMAPGRSPERTQSGLVWKSRSIWWVSSFFPLHRPGQRYSPTPTCAAEQRCSFAVSVGSSCAGCRGKRPVSFLEFPAAFKRTSHACPCSQPLLWRKLPSSSSV